MIFFFGCISENILLCYAKDKIEGAGVRRAFFENGLRKNWA